MLRKKCCFALFVSFGGEGVSFLNGGEAQIRGEGMLMATALALIVSA